MKLNIAQANSFVYPDMMVVCGDIDFLKNRTDIITNPILIIEVLSPSTQAFDRSKKFEYYRSVASMREYVLVSQEEPMIEVFFRQTEKIWLYSAVKGIEERVVLQTIEHELALKDVYRKVDWNQPAL
jgi:Uma2 family endonuclease